MIPPTTTGMDWAFSALRQSISWRQRVRWAPERIESPITSTSSWIASWPMAAPGSLSQFERGEVAVFALGIVGDPEGREPDPLPHPEGSRVGLDDPREKPEIVDLYDPKDQGLVEARRHPRFLHGEGVTDSLLVKIHPLVLVGAALGTEAARGPVHALAAPARGRDQAAGGQVLVELVELRLLRRLEGIRVGRPEIRHGRSLP